MPLKKPHQSQGTAKVKNICPVAVTTAVQMTVLGKMSCRQLFTSIFFVTRCHCTHKCVPGTPGNLGTEGLRTWEEVASYSSTAVWLSLLPSGLAPISVFTSFWSRSRFIHFCSKRFTVDLRKNFFFFSFNFKNSINDTLQYIPAQAWQAEELAFELLQKGSSCSHPRWAN